MSINELLDVKVDTLMSDDIINSTSGLDLLLACGIDSGYGSYGK